MRSRPPLPGPGQVVHIERRHLEHRAGAFAVRSRDDRGVEIVESVFVEIFVDGVSHGVTDAEHRTERVGARTQVGDFAQKLQRMPLLLQGIALGVGRTVNLDFSACTSTPCPAPGEATRRPSTRRQAPVVTGLSCSSEILARSTTTCILPTHDPSFRAMNATFLLPRLVRTQPLRRRRYRQRPISGFLRFSAFSYLDFVCVSSRFFRIDKVNDYLRFVKKSTFGAVTTLPCVGMFHRAACNSVLNPFNFFVPLS